MDWIVIGTIAALISALAAAVSALIACREYRDKNNTKFPRSAQRSAPLSAQRQVKPIRIGRPSPSQTYPPTPPIKEKSIKRKDPVKLNNKYRRLQKLLAEGKWKEADMETYRLMLAVMGKEEGESLDIEELENFPCDVLRNIDRLWLYYSNGKFGFSVQMEIYDILGGTSRNDEELWKRFCDRIGWRQGGRFLRHSDLTFSYKNAPKGHLPTPPINMSYLFEREKPFFDTGTIGVLFSRASICNL